MYELREIHRAIAELAYIVARAHHGIKLIEKEEFYKIIEEELKYQAWAAESRFETLDEVTHPSLEEAYNFAFGELRKYKNHFTPDLKRLTMRVLYRVAECYKGTSEFQEFIIGRVKRDLRLLAGMGLKQ